MRFVSIVWKRQYSFSGPKKFFRPRGRRGRVPKSRLTGGILSAGNLKELLDVGDFGRHLEVGGGCWYWVSEGFELRGRVCAVFVSKTRCFPQLNLDPIVRNIH